MADINLVDLQQSLKPITNPFGFDFVHKYAGKKVLLPGDGETRWLIGELRDHLARHLYMKVRYQYHDEQVAKLKDANKDQEARRYHVPEAVENKIYQMITGELLHTRKDEDEATRVEADLRELRQQMSSVEADARNGSGTAMNISGIVDAMNADALAKLSESGADSAHAGGTIGVDRIEVDDAAPTVVTDQREGNFSNLDSLNEQ